MSVPMSSQSTHNKTDSVFHLGEHTVCPHVIICATKTHISLVFEILKRNNQKDFVFVTYKKSTNLDYTLHKRRR